MLSAAERSKAGDHDASAAAWVVEDTLRSRRPDR